MNTKRTILDRAIDALEDYLNAGHKELRRQAAEKAKKVYEDYYGKPYENRVKASLKKEERIYVPDSVKIGHGAIINGDKRLYYSRIFKGWFVCVEPQESTTMQRPYLEKVEKLEVGKVYLMQDKLCASIPVNSLSQYRLYLGGDKFAYWGRPHLFEASAKLRDFYFYEVKDESN